MRRTLRPALGVAVAGLLACRMAAGAAPIEGLRYKTSFMSVRALGLDLYRSMRPKQREAVSSEPVSLETDVAPFVKVTEYPDEERPLRFVFVSAGFIDLMNNVAHAKAIDTVEKGYFQKYIVSLAQETGEKELKPLPDLSNPAYWTDAVLNEQASNFNQMVGAIVAIKLAHHYLGHYKKYAARVEDAQGRRVAINSLLTEGEWGDALRAGVENALAAGLGIEGIAALFDAIGRMPQRPDWTAYFLPPKANVKAMQKTLAKLERKSFGGEE